MANDELREALRSELLGVIDAHLGQYGCDVAEEHGLYHGLDGELADTALAVFEAQA